MYLKILFAEMTIFNLFLNEFIFLHDVELLYVAENNMMYKQVITVNT